MDLWVYKYSHRIIPVGTYIYRYNPMYTMEKTKPFGSRVVWLLLLGMVLINTAAAAELKMTDFTGNNGSSPLDGVGDAKPLMIEVVAIVIGFFLLTCIISAFVSGTTANMGNILHDVTIRSRGIMGVVTVLGIIFVVIVTLVMFFHLYNKYLNGM